MSLYFRR